MLEFIWQEIRNAFTKHRKHRLIFFLSVLAFACACAGINASMNWTLEGAQARDAGENTYGEKTAFEIVMDGESDSFSRVFSNENAGNVKALFDALKADDSFEFRYTTENLIDFFDPYNPDFGTEDFPAYRKEFLFGYEDGIAAEYSDYLQLKAFYADRLFCSEHGITLEEGRLFTDDDFIVNSPENIVLPVLLGSEYCDLYKIGDKIENAHMGTLTTITLEVIGFLGKGSYFYDCNTMKQTLDRYMVVPSPETAYDGRQSDGSYDDFTHSSYDSFKLWGTRILCDEEDSPAVKSRVTNLMREHGFSELYLFEESKGYEEFLSSTREYTITSIVATIFIIFMIIIMFCIQTYYRITRDQKKYCILMLNGISSYQLFLLVSAETLLVFLLSAILFWVMKFTLGNMPYFDFGLSVWTFAVIAATEGLLVMVTGCYGVRKIRQLDISTVLREHE